VSGYPDDKLLRADDRAWIPTLVRQAGAKHPLLTGLVATRAEDLLREVLSQRPLKNSELATIAKELLAGMAPASSEGRNAE
jgi:hypothetical protein